MRKGSPRFAIRLLRCGRAVWVRRAGRLLAFAVWLVPASAGGLLALAVWLLLGLQVASLRLLCGGSRRACGGLGRSD
jgi:hypothetical protein